MSSSSINVAVKEIISFIFMAVYYSLVYIYHIFIQSPIDEHLGWFHMFGFVNSAAINIWVQVSFWYNNLFFFG